MTSDMVIDRDQLRRKYREERDKRLKVEHRADYVRLEGELSDRYDQDPWVSESAARDPVVREVEAIVAGGGFAGLLAGASMRKAGFAADDICVIERGGDFGGTWYWNRYPGISCDTESYVYLPLLEETGYIPTEKYAKGAEIFEHCQRIGRHFGLYDQALFETRVVAVRWDEDQSRWIARTDRGDEIRGRYLWMCGGATNSPKLPGVPGITDFAGHSFHSMRWDYDYTGGRADGRLTKLKDKRVGLIGTGASAIQCVPPLGEWSRHFTVFQRTPSSVNVRANRPTDPEWAKQLQPGWQIRRMENFLSIVTGIPQDEDLVDDAWTWNFRNVMRVYEQDKRRKPTKDVQELADFERMNQIRDRVDDIVTDKETAEGLKAWYGLLCKRPTFHDEYLQTFNRPNVSLVHTNGRGIERITERGIVANGREYELDCIVYATGFDSSSGMLKTMGVNPEGVEGIALTDRFAQGFSTLHGLHVSQFPNMFIIGGPQSTLATTFTYGLHVQAEQCARIMAHCRDEGITRMEVKPQAEQDWQTVISDSLTDHNQYFQDCTPGYYNREGETAPIWNFFFGGGPIAYRDAVETWFDERLAQDIQFG
ncbi:MAG: NAD(P)/FAD-dependent oxidoreductase [Novosphingobium sp.]|nr:NAD(P)/FAD-dependent oxidoreductase [Novosphingobium sp.]